MGKTSLGCQGIFAPRHSWLNVICCSQAAKIMVQTHVPFTWLTDTWFRGAQHIAQQSIRNIHAGTSQQQRRRLLEAIPQVGKLEINIWNPRFLRLCNQPVCHTCRNHRRRFNAKVSWLKQNSHTKLYAAQQRIEMTYITMLYPCKLCIWTESLNALPVLAN